MFSQIEIIQKTSGGDFFYDVTQYVSQLNLARSEEHYEVSMVFNSKTSIPVVSTVFSIASQPHKGSATGAKRSSLLELTTSSEVLITRIKNAEIKSTVTSAKEYDCEIIFRCDPFFVSSQGITGQSAGNYSTQARLFLAPRIQTNATNYAYVVFETDTALPASRYTTSISGSTYSGTYSLDSSLSSYPQVRAILLVFSNTSGIDTNITVTVNSITRSAYTFTNSAVIVDAYRWDPTESNTLSISWSTNPSASVTLSRIYAVNADAFLAVNCTTGASGLSIEMAENAGWSVVSGTKEIFDGTRLVYQELVTPQTSTTTYEYRYVRFV